MKKLLLLINQEIYEYFELIVSHIPGLLGSLIRRIFYKITLAKCGKNFRVSILCRIQAPKNVYIGHNSGLNVGTIIASNKDSNGSIIIGDNVLIGHYCFFHSGNHKYKDKKNLIRSQGYTFNKIVVEDDVWIGAKCTILSGVRIGKGSVVGANSTVVKDVPPNCVVVGTPAKIIGQR